MALVQFATGTVAAGTSFTVTLPSAPQVGNLLVIRASAPIATINTVSGGGVTWTQNGSTSFQYGPGSSGVGTVITITLNISDEAAAIVAEFSGVVTTNPVDVTPLENTGTSTSPVTNSYTTLNPNDLLVAGCATTGAPIFSAPTNGWTLVGQVAGTNIAVAMSYQIVSTTGTQSTGLTLSSSQSWGFRATSFIGVIEFTDEDPWIPTRIPFEPIVSVWT